MAPSAFSPDDVRANRDWFAAKMRAEKQKIDAVRRVEGKPGAGDFLLLDTRGRDAFAKAHVRGAICVPLDEIEALAPGLPKDRELVTYCWSDT